MVDQIDNKMLDTIVLNSNSEKTNKIIHSQAPPI